MIYEPSLSVKVVPFFNVPSIESYYFHSTQQIIDNSLWILPCVSTRLTYPLLANEVNNIIDYPEDRATSHSGVVWCDECVKDVCLSDRSDGFKSKIPHPLLTHPSPRKMACYQWEVST